MSPKRRDRQPTVRQLRVGEELRHCLAGVLGRGDLRDPALRGQTITVSEVRVSPDLRAATVFVSALGSEIGPILSALERAAPFLQAQLAREVHLRYLPRLAFRRDESFEEAERIESLLRSPEVARDLGADRSIEEGDNGPT